tara:strand:- start:679 stop:2160 length:1482 start_codon:yes stop_codon:yes gene_type:complete
LHFNIKNILKSNGFDSKEDYVNIYINLYEALKKAIINRSLDVKTKLPPSRVLAKDIEVSRSTVIKAYDLLVLEKYIKSIPGSGYYVTSPKNKKILINLNSNTKKGKYPKISKRGKSFNKHIIINNSQSNKGIAFRPGLPPLDIFPVQQWNNLSNHYWRTVKSSELSYSKTIGLDSLRENIANYLKLYRNINCGVDQIVVTSGSLHSLYLLGNALIDKNDEVIIENPTYPHAYHLFDSLNAKICPIAIDNEGMSVKEIKCQNPKFVYTTPSNQYPSGIKMSVNRRLELLKWASNKNTFIVEDDYDHEFSNWENPVASIYNLDRQERVIYLGTFNKLLHPSIRLGYMIVPYYLLDTITALYEQSSRFVTLSMQKTMSLFIEKDYLNKHLRNVIEISVERKQSFLDYFNLHFNNKISLDSNNTGLHLIGKLKDSIKDIKVANYLSQNGIIAHPLSNYYIGNNNNNGLVMGYCSVNNKLIKDNITKMSKAYERFLIS